MMTSAPFAMVVRRRVEVGRLEMANLVNERFTDQLDGLRRTAEMRLAGGYP